MGLGQAFVNSFTSGEISADAWDRVDLQPIAKGCEEATNLVIRIPGPLGKRRGFWDLGAVIDETKTSRLIPFRRSIDDALMLEFGDAEVRVLAANGAPTGVSFASPFSAADVALLRFKQVADVIYFRTSDGQPPQTLTRESDASWSFALEGFPNGPWLAENADETFTLTISGADEGDGNNSTGAGCILKGQAVTLVASSALFQPGHVGAYFRTRQGDGTASCYAWAPSFPFFISDYAISVDHQYRNVTAGQAVGDAIHSGGNPPVQLAGQQSDGAVMWDYRHDGAGVIQITAVADSTHASGTVTQTHPLLSAVATSYWSEAAYSDFRGWPRMWPAVREERLVSGATAANLDMLDLTQTAGFDPSSETYYPGTGMGSVLDIHACRRRLGDDGGEIVWAAVATYLICGSASNEYLVGANLVDDPISPASIVTKPISGFGSADAAPVKAHKGLIYITRGAQTLREVIVDSTQQVETDDLTVLAQHIAVRSFVQLAWIPQPDNVLWARLADGGLAAMTYHQEQSVRGWTRQQLPGGWICEDIAALPGPGRLETLWIIVSRTKGEVTQRHLWMLSQPSDALFVDGAQLYQGAPATVIAGLDAYEGESVRGLADGAQFDAVVTGGAITLTTAASTVAVGLKRTSRFKSLELNFPGFLGTTGRWERITQVISSLTTTTCTVGLDGAIAEKVTTRARGDIPATVSRRTKQQTNVAGDASRDPRLVIEDDSAYDFAVNSLRITGVVGS